MAPAFDELLPCWTEAVALRLALVEAKVDDGVALKVDSGASCTFFFRNEE